MRVIAKSNHLQQVKCKPTCSNFQSLYHFSNKVLKIYDSLIGILTSFCGCCTYSGIYLWGSFNCLGFCILGFMINSLFLPYCIHLIIIIQVKINIALFTAASQLIRLLKKNGKPWFREVSWYCQIRAIECPFMFMSMFVWIQGSLCM